jgi:hypothetical protein
MFTMSEPEWEGTNHSALSSINDIPSLPDLNRIDDALPATGEIVDPPMHRRILRCIVKSFMFLIFLLPSLGIIGIILVIGMIPILILFLTVCALCIVRPQQVINSFRNVNRGELREWDMSIDWPSGNSVPLYSSQEAIQKMLDIRIVQDLESYSSKSLHSTLNDDNVKPMDDHTCTDIHNDLQEMPSPKNEADPIVVMIDTSVNWDVERGGSIDVHSQESLESSIAVSHSTSPCDDKKDDDIESNHGAVILLDLKSNPTCDICLMEYQIGDEVTISRNPDCLHIFHKACIIEWLRKRQTCPCCRRNYLNQENIKRIDEEESEDDVDSDDTST